MSGHDTEGETIEDVRTQLAAMCGSYREAREVVKLREADVERWRRRAEEAEAERDALGLQLAAQSERLRLAMAVVEAARGIYDDREVLPVEDPHPHHYAVPCEWVDIGIGAALAALDAVPGDALAKVGTLNGVSVHVDPNLPEHMPAVGFTDARWVGPDGEPER